MDQLFYSRKSEKSLSRRKKITKKFHVVAGVLVTPYKFDPHTIIAVLELPAHCIDRVPAFDFKFVDSDDAEERIELAAVVFVAGSRDMRKALLNWVANPRSTR
jgi:hypothetical protein